MDNSYKILSDFCHVSKYEPGTFDSFTPSQSQI